MKWPVGRWAVVRLPGEMGIELPAAHIFDDTTGEYRVVNESDAATSGGDIGAQVALYPVIWVSDR